MDFAFEVRTLPDEIAVAIREGLATVDSEEAIKAVFTFEYTAAKKQDDPIVPIKSDLAILELADAINKAADKPEVKADPPLIINNYITNTPPAVTVTNEIPTQDVTVNVPEQPAAVVNVEVAAAREQYHGRAGRYKDAKG